MQRDKEVIRPHLCSYREVRPSSNRLSYYMLVVDRITNLRSSSCYVKTVISNKIPDTSTVLDNVPTQPRGTGVPKSNDVTAYHRMLESGDKATPWAPTRTNKITKSKVESLTITIAAELPVRIESVRPYTLPVSLGVEENALLVLKTDRLSGDTAAPASAVAHM